MDNVLGIVLESADYGALLGECERICDEYDDMQLKLGQLNARVANLKVKLCARLAIEIRKSYPKLYVSINDKGVRIGYKSKFLMLRPDINGKVWDIQSNNAHFERGFINNYRKYLLLHSKLGDLVDAIGHYFESVYKSLGEEMVDDGYCVVEGAESSLVGIVNWASARGVIL